jgi:hypothetical protein
MSAAASWDVPTFAFHVGTEVRLNDKTPWLHCLLLVFEQKLSLCTKSKPYRCQIQTPLGFAYRKGFRRPQVEEFVC